MERQYEKKLKMTRQLQKVRILNWKRKEKPQQYHTHQFKPN